MSVEQTDKNVEWTRIFFFSPNHLLVFSLRQLYCGGPQNKMSTHGSSKAIDTGSRDECPHLISPIP